MTFLTVDEVYDRWRDAPANVLHLTRLLEAAHEQVIEYAPALPAGATVPARYAEAELLQVRALGQAHERDGDVLGFGDGFAVRVRPLGSEVKALLRPKRGAPTLG